MNLLQRTLLAASLAAVIHSPGWSQELYESWSPEYGAPPGGLGMNARVYDLVVFDDDLGSGPQLCAGGDFTNAGGADANRIASWNGSSWTPLGLGMNSSVFGLVAMPGLLFAGGSFTMSDGLPANRLAMWDGSSWSSLMDFNSGLDGTNGNVYVLCLYDEDMDGEPELFVGGQFSSAGGVPANNIARWDFSGDWSALGSGTSGGVIPGRIDALTVFDDGAGPALYAGGFFTSAGGVGASLVAKWDGLTWSPVGSGLDGDNVYDLVVFDDGAGPALYAGGSFYEADGIGVSNVAKWDGASWSAVGDGFDDAVRDLHVYNDAGTPVLCATGHFLASGSTTCSLIARWDGASWQPLGSGLSGDLGISLCMADHDFTGNGTDLFVGGIFDTAGDWLSAHLAQWVRGRHAPFGVVPGEVAVTTMGNSGAEYVLSLVDVRPPFPAPNTNWGAPMFHNEFAPSATTEIWNRANLGQVFGVCFDMATVTQGTLSLLRPNIYVAATSTYYSDVAGPNGMGAVYKIHGGTGNISLFIQLPQSNQTTGPGLGDVCYDRYHNQWFISNFEDGKIYRVKLVSDNPKLPGIPTVVQAFDPFAADDGAPGFAPLGERVWALQVHNSRQLYFSVWLRDKGRQNEPWPASWPPQGANPANNAIFVCVMNGSGAIANNWVLSEVLPPLEGFTYSNPCSDITFSPDLRRMLIAERGMLDDTDPVDNAAGVNAAHENEVLEFVGGGPGNGALNWGPSPFEYWIGQGPSQQNASGGADYDCGLNVFATGNGLVLPPTLMYGLQRVPSGGNTQATSTATSQVHDMNGNTSIFDKTEIGDCEVYRPFCRVGATNWAY